MKICIEFEKNRIDYGLFYVESGNVCFPYKNWEDFHLSIIIYWIQELLANEHLDCAEFEIAFMEGPYCLFCQKHGDLVCVRGKQDGNRSFENNFSETILYSELKILVYNVAATIIKKANCESNKNNELAKDVDLLEELWNTGDGSLCPK